MGRNPIATQPTLHESINQLPLQGVYFLGNRTRRDAAGWYVLPYQGEGLIGNL
ncbi:MAG: hypothetical protein LBG58_01690 [Planctomycetaceae bacterium]|jgi:hypothetical protein|nr:hypothetical protein [Planctomycetaceae bacterium]